MIDFHSHVLPDIDDGSRDLEESVKLLKYEIAQHVTIVVATPHFYADKASIRHFLELRENSYQKLCKRLDKEEIPKEMIYLSAEVYYFSGIGKTEMLGWLCIPGTNWLLLEMPFCQWNKEMFQDVEQIIYKQKIRVILAHVERYLCYQKDKTVWNDILHLPVILQINAGSLLEWPQNKKFLKLFKEDKYFVLGSDCHNMETRVPNLKEGRAVISRKLGKEYLSGIDDVGKRILQINN